MTERELLLQAAQYIKAGQRAEAVKVLSGIVRDNPGSEQGWLLLGHCLKDPERKKQCYQKVLEINPRNDRAQEFLMEAYLDVKDEERSVEENLREEARSEKARRKSDGFKLLSGLTPRGRIILVVGLALLFIVVGFLSPLFIRGGTPDQNIGGPTAIPANTSAPAGSLSLPPTWTPTPFLSPTPTLVPSPTATPTATPQVFALPTMAVASDSSFGAVSLEAGLEEAFNEVFNMLFSAMGGFFEMDAETVGRINQAYQDAETVDQLAESYSYLTLGMVFTGDFSGISNLANDLDVRLNLLLPELEDPREIAIAYTTLLQAASISEDASLPAKYQDAIQEEIAPLADLTEDIEALNAIYGALSLSDEANANQYAQQLAQRARALWDGFDTIPEYVAGYKAISFNTSNDAPFGLHSETLPPPGDLEGYAQDVLDNVEGLVAGVDDVDEATQGYFLLAEAAAKLGDYARGLGYFQQAAALNPGAETFSAVAFGYLSQEDQACAYYWLGLALESDTDSLEYLAVRGLFKLIHDGIAQELNNDVPACEYTLEP